MIEVKTVFQLEAQSTEAKPWAGKEDYNLAELLNAGWQIQHISANVYWEKGPEVLRSILLTRGDLRGERKDW